MNFGRTMLGEWLLDPDVTYLNHGTVGAPPRRGLEAQQKIRDEIERRPSEFLLRDLRPSDTGRSLGPEPLLRTAARDVARFVHAREQDLGNLRLGQRIDLVHVLFQQVKLIQVVTIKGGAIDHRPLTNILHRNSHKTFFHH